MKRKTLWQIEINLISLFAFISFTSLYCQPVKARSQLKISSINAAQIQIQLKKKQQSGEGRGRPSKRRGMGSRNDCPGKNIPLTALIPENNIGKVVEANPTFWLFMPYKSGEVPKGEFILQDENHNDIYRTDFRVNKGEGIVGISLGPEKSLEINKNYQWYFKLYCDPGKSSTPIYVRGWVKRIALQPQQQKELSAISPRQRVSFYLRNGIWYSALTELAELRWSNPNNKNLAQDWSQLLDYVGLQDLLNQPIVGQILGSAVASEGKEFVR